MFAYIVRRLLYAIPILIGVNLLTFTLFFVVNSPDDMAVSQLGEKYVTPEAIATWKKKNGYDKDEEILKELKEYRNSLAIPYMTERDLVDPKIEALYKRRLEEVRAAAGDGQVALVEGEAEHATQVLVRLDDGDPLGDVIEGQDLVGGHHTGGVGVVAGRGAGHAEPPDRVARTRSTARSARAPRPPGRDRSLRPLRRCAREPRPPARRLGCRGR